jgi:hypothetical protein
MMADEVSIEFVSRQLDRVLTEIRGLRQDIDMLTRIVLRLDSTVDALREDVKTLWLSQGDLRRRIEALEARR